MLTAIIIAVVVSLITGLIKAVMNSGTAKQNTSGINYASKPLVFYQMSGGQGQNNLPMYVSKNNQQAGPYPPEQVLAWLNSGQLSPFDMAIKKGDQQWQPLKTYFTAQQNTAPSAYMPFTPIPQTAPVNQKKSSFNKSLFVLLGIGGLGFVGFLGLITLLSINKRTTVNNLSNSSNVRNSSVSNTNSSNSNSATTYGEKYSELLGKKDELLKNSFSLKSVTNPVIKGKVFIVESDESNNTDDDSYKYTDSDFGFAQIRQAKSLEEIDTLIQVVCKKGGFYGNYDNGGQGYTNVCKVTVNDFKAKTAIAQKTFTNGTRKASVESYNFDENNNYINPRPIAQIYQYISGIRIDKALSIDEEELGRLSSTLKPNSSAKINGKYAVAVKYPILDGIPEYSRYQIFGLPSDKKASKPEEIDTLIQVNCQRGSQIGKKLKTTFYSNKCLVNLIDFKTLSIFAQKTIENKKLDADAIGDEEAGTEVVDIPDSEIEEYLQTFLDG